MATADLAHYLPIYRDGLLQNTVPFWQTHAPDWEQGGFYSMIGRDGSTYGTDKMVWIQGRTGWLYSRLYNEVEQREDWLVLAKHALDFLDRHAFDTDGRMFFHLTRDGRPVRKRRYLFSETFAAIAFAEYARATGDDAARQRAREILHLIHRYHTTPGLLPPKGNPAVRDLKSHAMPMILLATVQVLREVDDDPLHEQIVEQSIHEVRDHFFKPELGCLLEAVGPHGEFLDEPDGRVVNPGHAIETSWFLFHEAQHRGGDRDLIDLGCQILDLSLAVGWDAECGGIRYFVDAKGYPAVQYEHDMKLWWPMNEAIYATLLAYHLTGQEQYRVWHQRLHDWAYRHFPDREHGEWYGYLRRDGAVSQDIKGGYFKGPFHLPRMELNCWKLLTAMLGG